MVPSRGIRRIKENIVKEADDVKLVYRETNEPRTQKQRGRHEGIISSLRWGHLVPKGWTEGAVNPIPPVPSLFPTPLLARPTPFTPLPCL